MEKMHTRRVWVDRNGRGTWEVGVTDRRDRIRCETIDEARRAAYICAAEQHPCEVIVRDAYHRVLHRELVDSIADRAGADRADNPAEQAGLRLRTGEPEAREP